jgi:photosystem II stability/assembly factor-like uncharacterized protein
MLPPIPPNPNELRRAMAHVPQLKVLARRRRRTRRAAIGGIGAIAITSAVAVSAWLIPTGKSTKVNVFSPAPATSPVQAPTTAVPAPSTGPPGLAYTGPGVALVGVSGLAPGYQGTRPSQLYLSTDLVHWSNVTPPQSQLPQRPGEYLLFDQASFLSPSTGWVTTWNPDTLMGVIYRTSDGGRTWSAIPGPGHGDHAGDAFRLQLLSPTTAFGESIHAAAPGWSLEVTTDAGLTWRTVYTGPLGTPSGGRNQGPFELPIVFVDALHGFAAEGIPPAEFSSGEGDFFYTSNGGSSWVRRSPPLPNTAGACPTGAGTTSSTSCRFALPVFGDTQNGVLAATETSGSHADVVFDLTTDGGQHWTAASQRSVTVNPNATQQGGLIRQSNFGYPLVSVASASSWWVLGWGPAGATTQVSADAGANWTPATAPIPAGVPVALGALNASHALLTVENVTANGVTTNVLSTVNGGRSWNAVNLPG